MADGRLQARLGRAACRGGADTGIARCIAGAIATAGYWEMTRCTLGLSGYWKAHDAPGMERKAYAP
jgi:hypothetical protein